MSENSDAARRYHEQTKHSWESVRRGGPGLDWDNRPHPFKEYRGLAPQPAPAGLERLLRLGAGVVRTRREPGGLEYHFRTYSSAGALYPVEIYAATPDGLFHFHPGELALRRLRGEDVRGALADGEVVLVLTGILWRTAWKYGARGYRHLWWDAGTMLANLLALAPEARVLTGFVDDEVNRLVAADGEREAALCLLALGREEPPAPPAVEELRLDIEPLSRVEREYPLASELHRAACLQSPDAVRRWRELEPERATESWPAPLEPLLRRRGSLRDFSPEPVAAEELGRILARALDPIPADVGPSTELYGVVNAVEGLPAGAYRFEPPDGFQLLRAGDFRLQAGYLALEQPLGALAAATLFFMADLEAVLDRLGDRGYRWAQLEAGIRTGRVYLAGVAAGLGATASTFYDDDVSRFFDVGRSPLLCVALGHPRGEIAAAGTSTAWQP